MRTKKKKLLTVKEARTRVEVLEREVQHRDLLVNKLENEVDSLEGARVNLRMMYDTHEIEMNLAKIETQKALIGIKKLNQDFERTISLAEQFRDRIKAYEAESSFQLYKRSVSKLFAPVHKSVKSFFERLKFGRKKAY